MLVLPVLVSLVLLPVLLLPGAFFASPALPASPADAEVWDIAAGDVGLLLCHPPREPNQGWSSLRFLEHFEVLQFFC